MKPLIGLIVLLFTTCAFAQTAPPKAAKRPPAHQVKPQAPMGCKLVGTVKGTKLWAGDCADAAGLRGAPADETTPPAAEDAIPSGQKQ
jgi:hypothetical protein